MARRSISLAWVAVILILATGTTLAAQSAPATAGNGAKRGLGEEVTEAEPSILYFDFFYTFGYRWVHVNGDRDRFDTDYNLDSGFRLTELRFDGRVEPASEIHRVLIESHDLADPYVRARTEFEKIGVYKASADFRRSRYKYRGSGEFHRVDRKDQVTSYQVSVPLRDGDVEVFAGFSRSDHDGFWLTNRIGNQNISPLYTITNVQSPRRVSEDEAELGVTFHLDDTAVTFAGSYVDHNEDNRWIYSQPAVANPAFLESEDSSAGSALEGPAIRVDVAHHDGPLDVTVGTRWLDRRRRIVGRGTGMGFDAAQFSSTGSSLSEGAARTILLDGAVSYELRDDLTFHTDLRYLDHKEHLQIDQTDVFVYPTLASTVTVNTMLDQRTSSRLREATAEMDWQATKGVVLTGGWGWSQEKLRLPDLDGSDADFAVGTVIEDGFLAGAQWKPDGHWTVRTRYRDFGQGGLQLHEVVDNHTRGIEGSVGFRKESLWWQTDVKHRRSQNPVSDSRTSNTAYTLSGGYAPDENFHWHGSYTLSDIDSRTRTNFYFDPSPTPVSTLVGFKGETHTVSAGVDWTLENGFRAAVQGTYTTVHGDFELDMFQWSADLSTRLTNGRAGVRLEQADYHEAGNPDDYDAWMTYAYYSVAMKGPRGGPR